MLCHECMMIGRQQPAVALCEFCHVGLCKPHLVELYRSSPTTLQYSCRHRRAAPAPVRSSVLGVSVNGTDHTPTRGHGA